jgi:hypothetical protein
MLPRLAVLAAEGLRKNGRDRLPEGAHPVREGRRRGPEQYLG